MTEPERPPAAAGDAAEPAAPGAAAVVAAPQGAPMPVLGAAHRRRLREVWRSAGWPFQDPLEAELLAGGWLTRERDHRGHETVRVSDAGVAALAETLQRNRAARAAHEALVERVAREMQRAGRLVWRGLTLRAWVSDGMRSAPAGPADDGAWAFDAAAPASGPLPSTVRRARRRVQPQADWLDDGGGATGSPEVAATPVGGLPAEAAAGAVPGAPADTGRWALAMPDVYSIRQTSQERYLLPVAHEIKVRRADLLADLRRPAKGEAYRWLAAECWYVIREGIARPEEIPVAYGVLVAPPIGPLVVARPAPQRAMRLPFGVWMALARARAEPADEDAQALLAPADAGDRPHAPQAPPLDGAEPDRPGAGHPDLGDA